MSMFIRIRGRYGSTIGISLTNVKYPEDIKRLVTKVNDMNYNPYLGKYDELVAYKVSASGDTSTIIKCKHEYSAFPPHDINTEEEVFSYTPTPESDSILVYESGKFKSYRDLEDLLRYYDSIEKL